MCDTRTYTQKSARSGDKVKHVACSKLAREVTIDVYARTKLIALSFSTAIANGSRGLTVSR